MPANDCINTIICGDCIEVMKGWPADTFDGIVTDPPYGIHFMGKTWDKFGGAVGKSHLTTSKRHGCMHAGSYDYSKNPEFQQVMFVWATEALRIAKPGAMMLIFGGTRTYHRLTCAIEDAGWQIRDDIANFIGSDYKLLAFYESLNAEQKGAFEELFLPSRILAWVYGSGFPKSTNISLRFDKRACFELGVKQLGRKPTKEEFKKAWETFRVVVGKNPNDREKRENVLSDYGLQGGVGKGSITKPKTDLAKLWNGYGTALKPSWEPIIVAMKPLDGTFAQNAEKWGVAGLNIDGGRLQTQPEPFGNPTCGFHDCLGRSKKKREQDGTEHLGKGRWPTNVILDEEAAELLDQQSGELTSGKMQSVAKGGNFNTYGKQYERQVRNPASSGGASRFFYCAKASRAERNAGLEGSTPKQVDLSRKPENPGGNNPRNRGARKDTNFHPTVKPLKLMEYLCKLVRPPSEHPILLDPFCGSGSTLLAAENTGWDYIGIEKESDYAEISRKRLNHQKEQYGLYE